MTKKTISVKKGYFTKNYELNLNSRFKIVGNKLKLVEGWAIKTKPKKVTGSRIGSMLGIGDYADPFVTWGDMVYGFKSVIDEKYAEIGKTLESQQIKYLNKVTSSKYFLKPQPKKSKKITVASEVEEVKAEVFDEYADHMIFGGSKDSYNLDAKDLLECKTTGHKNRKKWGYDKKSNAITCVPEEYLRQGFLYAWLEEVVNGVKFETLTFGATFVYDWEYTAGKTKIGNKTYKTIYDFFEEERQKLGKAKLTLKDRESIFKDLIKGNYKGLKYEYKGGYGDGIKLDNANTYFIQHNVSELKEMFMNDIHRAEALYQQQFGNDIISPEFDLTNEVHFAILNELINARCIENTNENKGKNTLWFDFETTGLLDSNPEIIEYGAKVRNEKGEVVAVFDELAKPSYKIDAKITELTGLTNEDLEGCRDTKTVFKDFIKFIEKNEIGTLAGFNIMGFDNVILMRYCKELGLDINFLGFDFIDVLDLARQNLKSELKKIQEVTGSKNLKLENLCQYYGIEVNNHCAIDDVDATIQIHELITGKR